MNLISNIIIIYSIIILNLIILIIKNLLKLIKYLEKLIILIWIILLQNKGIIKINAIINNILI